MKQCKNAPLRALLSENHHMGGPGFGDDHLIDQVGGVSRTPCPFSGSPPYSTDLKGEFSKHVTDLWRSKAVKGRAP